MLQLVQRVVTHPCVVLFVLFGNDYLILYNYGPLTQISSNALIGVEEFDKVLVVSKASNHRK